MILDNGVVRTLDPQLPLARALAIAGEHVAGGVGVHETALASPDVVDLGGRCVVPGFTAHGTFSTWAIARHGGDALDAMRHALKTAAARGVTCVHDHDTSDLAAWQQLRTETQLTLRVRQLVRPEQLEQLQAAGIRQGFGDDLLRIGPVLTDNEAGDVDLDPWATVNAAVSEQGATIDEAFDAACLAPARATGEERRRGRLLPGFLADLVILDRDPFVLSVDALLEVRVTATMVGGRWTHGPPPWN